MFFFIFALVGVITSTFTRALAGMWIFNWYAPVVYPGVSASYMQALAALVLFSALYCMFTSKSPDTDTEDARIKLMRTIFTQTVFQPFITAALFGFIYLCCVYPFT